jgi:hypothetical protein
VNQAQAAMSWVDLETGHIRHADEVRLGSCQAAGAMRAIDCPGARQVADYLTNRASGLAS